MDYAHLFVSLRNVSRKIVKGSRGQMPNARLIEACREAVRSQENMLHLVPDDTEIKFAGDVYTAGMIIKLKTSVDMENKLVQLAIRLKDKPSVTSRDLTSIKRDLEKMNKIKFDRETIVPHSNINVSLLVIRGILNRFISYYNSNSNKFPNDQIVELFLLDSLAIGYLWWDVGILSELIDSYVDGLTQYSVSNFTEEDLVVTLASKLASIYWNDDMLDNILKDVYDKHKLRA